MTQVFIGSEAVAAGRVTKYDLRARHQRVLPDVYAPRGEPLAVTDRIRSAWLWSQRRGVIAGQSAATLHGAKWADVDQPVELILANTRPPRGVRTYADELLIGEWQEFDGLPVTTPARTAFDLGRRQDTIARSVTRLDALGNATGVSGTAIAAIALAHRGARNVRRLAAALDLYDAGAQSPKETLVRLWIVADGYPRPQTQIPVDCGPRRYYLDIGWEALMIAVEFDGGHHFATPEQVRYDIERLEALAGLGWIVIRLVAGMRRAEVLHRVRQAWTRRDCSGSELLAG